MEELRYKSYCWSFGTTSFRTKNFNKTIEKQLMLLEEFWKLPGHDEMSWSNNSYIQSEYYDFLHTKGFLEGVAARKDKDAREKTSGLVDIGLITEERVLTNVGEELLSVVSKKDIGLDELFHIPNDSMVYLKQLLKYGVGLDGKYIRPFVAIIYSICKLSYLSYDEFTYLLPLVTDKDSLDFIVSSIQKLRKGEQSINEIILNKLMSMSNYKDALDYFLDENVTKKVICAIGLNRKSRKYDEVYYNLYKYLFDKYVNGKSGADKKIIDAIKENGNSNISTRWMSLLYDTSNTRAIVNNPADHTNKTKFDNARDEYSFKKIFFRYMHLIKAKATLSDYFDLNMRYIRTTNCITFRDGKVELDTIPGIIFNNISTSLLDIINVESRDLIINIPIKDICSSIEISDQEFIKIADKKFNAQFTSKTAVFTAAEDIRYKKFNNLIDNLFKTDELLELLDWFENRNDKSIQSYLNCEADVPTIFEYVLGVIWYIVSDRKGKILDYMKLSLDADLLPRTHAAGGGSDIVYEYEATESYPKHTMLLEATLSESTGQRVMEMEPVSRHLGYYLIEHNCRDDYCTFITNKLNPNLLSDFRSRKNTPYYDTLDSGKSVPGMKIIPFETKLLKAIISKGYNYKRLYKIFDDAFISSEQPLEWYKNCIENIIV